MFNAFLSAEQAATRKPPTEALKGPKPGATEGKRRQDKGAYTESRGDARCLSFARIQEAVT